MTGFKSKKEMAMSKVADLMYDIETLYIDGLSAAQIAKELDCPIQTVMDALDMFGVADSPQGGESEYYGA
jgi:hypothetical protein